MSIFKNEFQVERVAAATFDASSGAAIATHGLGVFIPAKATVVDAWYEVETTFTSATDAATIALQANGADDLVAAIAISAAGDIWDDGSRGCLPGSFAQADGDSDTAILAAARKAGSFIKMSDTKELSAVVAVEALTAGKLNLFVKYIVSE